MGAVSAQVENKKYYNTTGVLLLHIINRETIYRKKEFITTNQLIDVLGKEFNGTYDMTRDYDSRIVSSGLARDLAALMASAYIVIERDKTAAPNADLRDIQRISLTKEG